MGDLSFISNLHVSILYFFLIVAAWNVLLDFWLTQHQDKSHVWENLLGNKPVSDSDLFSTFCDELRIYLPFCPSIVKPSNVCEGIVLHINNQTSSCKERGNRQPYLYHILVIRLVQQPPDPFEQVTVHITFRQQELPAWWCNVHTLKEVLMRHTQKSHKCFFYELYCFYGQISSKERQVYYLILLRKPQSDL